MFLNKINTSYLLMISLVFSACSPNQDDAKKYLPGKYLYERRSKEIEVLEIDSSFNFKQTIYSNRKAYINKDNYLFHNSKGKMIVKGSSIEFSYWLDVNHLENQDSLKINPEYIYYTGVSWMKSTKTQKVTIIMYDQNNYVFSKLD